MAFLGKIDRHSVLVNRMSNTLGADLVGAALDGAAPETVLRSAVFNCMACSDTEACEDWLAGHEDGAAEAPDYCRNKAILDRLARM